MSLKIEQINSDNKVVAIAEGENEAVLNTVYEDGDALVFTTDEKYISVKIHNDVKETILYIPDGSFKFPIPVGQALAGFATGTFEGEQTVSVRVTPTEELGEYRNLALNPLDYRVESEIVDPDAEEWSNPTNSPAIEQGEITAYPHVYANRVTRNEGCFYARNAVDGFINQSGHGNYPYHSWGGAVHEDLTFAVYFGRPVKVDKLVLYLRADFALDAEGREHDTYWHTARIELSDGYDVEINPKKSDSGQEFYLGEHTTEWLKLSRLDPYRSDMSLNYAALTQLEIMGKEL